MPQSELKEWMSGFENRMRFVNIVRCLLEHKYPDNIRVMIPNRQILDNLSVAVLVYIKERTLSDEERCTLKDVEGFLRDFSEFLPKDCHLDCQMLARFLVVEVLQHGGELTEFLTWNSEKSAFQNQAIRLVHEEKGSYHLTDDAFDFLFRSKEIESELDYSVTRFRMKEYMKRNNYSKALEQSRELVSRIRNMKTSMDDFLIRCRENLSFITVDEYDKVIQRIRSLLTDEESELQEIRQNARERQENLETARQSGVTGEEMRKHWQALDEIVRNISAAIEEQRSLINQRSLLQEQYGQILRDQYALERFSRMSFERDIMLPLRKLDSRLGDAAKYLLFPLSKPELPAMFSVENFYAPQSRITEEEQEKGIAMDDSGEDAFSVITEKRNQRFLSIFHSLFSYLVTQRFHFPARQYVASLEEAQLFEFCADNALLDVLLQLYAIGVLDISGWRNSSDPIPEPMGELEPTWCLSHLPKELLQMKELRISKLESGFTFTVCKENICRKIEMTDLDFEVVM